MKNVQQKEKTENQPNDETLALRTRVGIFWSVDGAIIGEAVNLADSEEYGDALQHGGHYEFWEKLKPATASERNFKAHSYDYYPRGRMVCFPKRRTARLYVDRCMDNAVRNFALVFFCQEENNVEIETDEHYCCARCNRHYLE